MFVFLWVVLFVISLIILVQSADWFVNASEKIAKFFKLSPFIIGVTVVALGTSLPELLTALIAVSRNNTEIVTANVIGSNIANILLVVGLAAVFARGLVLKRNIIDLDLPLLFLTSIIFSFVILDGRVNFFEGIVLIVTFLIYIVYTIKNRKEEEGEEKENLITENYPWRKQEKIRFATAVYFFVGAFGLVLGAKYTIESIINLSQLLNIAPSILTITAVAIGTSLPELVVSISAAMKKKYEIAVGNAIGSCVFNILMVMGIPALFKNLTVDAPTLNIGFPFFAVATMIFVVSGISKRINFWEGMMFIVVYCLFIVRLFGIF